MSLRWPSSTPSAARRQACSTETLLATEDRRRVTSPEPFSKAGNRVNWLTAALYLLLPAIAIAARKAGGSWYSPAAFFAAFWCIFAGLPLVASPIVVQPAGMLFLVAACAAGLPGRWTAQRRQRATEAPGPALAEPPLLGWLIAACTVFGVVVVVL